MPRLLIFAAVQNLFLRLMRNRRLKTLPSPHHLHYLLQASIRHLTRLHQMREYLLRVVHARGDIKPALLEHSRRIGTELPEQLLRVDLRRNAAKTVK